LIEGPVLIYIPSAFTPNNDGINDAFQVVISDLVSYELTIYNRWGDWVFHSTDPEDVWVGNVKGGDHYAPEGLYSYRIIWKGARTDSEELLGTFELMR
jgi:gliding motility-associated-like protein